MSWLFSQALVAEYSAATCSDGGQSVPLNTSRMPLLYLPSVKMTAFSRLSRFGMTFGHSTVESGAALLMWFRVDFLARTSAQQEPGPESPESVLGSGEKWRGSFAKYDRDSSTWKTHQYSLLGDLTLYSETWPRWGLMRDGECWEQSTLAPRTNGTESGLWQTPVADDAVDRKSGKWNSRGEPKLSAEVKLWPTPTVCGNHNRKGASKTSGDGLATAVAMWPTPKATDGTKGRPNQRGSKGDLTLPSAVHQRMFPTATATAWKGWSQNHNRADTDDRIDYTIEREAHEAGQNGRLNPEWVEWLMGWPLGWTDLKPLAMDRFREWLQQHGH